MPNPVIPLPFQPRRSVLSAVVQDERVRGGEREGAEGVRGGAHGHGEIVGHHGVRGVLSGREKGLRGEVQLHIRRGGELH